ncbi:DUF6153 family protein [Streptomyces sp. NBC_01233]|uniref:DUF6153 family protein n=1 Tax=Streptomyces sp. NBC_01233 TaxID=2903787 RepID=UPI002E13463B|nr:DUF6153 family protein [Streptomyces sp. NBC_01233]
MAGSRAQVALRRVRVRHTVGHVTGHKPRTRSQSLPVPRLGLLLVLALVFGLLGMHALGTAAALPSTGAIEHMSHHVAAAQADPRHPCPDDEDQGPTRDAGHADQMCTSAAPPGAPGIAAPDTAPLTGLTGGIAHAPAALALALAYEPAGGRAPPLLADLQILRI